MIGWAFSWPARESVSLVPSSRAGRRFQELVARPDHRGIPGIDALGFVERAVGSAIVATGYGGSRGIDQRGDARGVLPPLGAVATAIAARRSASRRSRVAQLRSRPGPGRDGRRSAAPFRRQRNRRAPPSAGRQRSPRAPGRAGLPRDLPARPVAAREPAQEQVLLQEQAPRAARRLRYRGQAPGCSDRCNSRRRPRPRRARREERREARCRGRECRPPRGTS